MCRSQGTQNISYLLVAEATTILTPAATFLVFSIVAVVGNSTTLLTNQAFTSLAVLALLGAPLASMIQAVPDLLAAVACFRRIQVFLDLLTGVTCYNARS
jgi:ABC-type siderophore export system fused ATPase/permease subunit